MRKIKLTLAYDGTDYHGWQVQPDQPSIQAELERVLAEIEGQTVHVDGAGRTDAGVHALAQVASLSLENPIPTENLRRAMNRLLPPAIRVLAAEEAPHDFHARRSARAKQYEYRIWRGEICDPMQYRYLYHHPYPLDREAMVAAAPAFEGTQDFRGLAAGGEGELGEGPQVRTVFSSRLEAEGDLWRYRVRGSGFLHHMVRNMMGTLLDVGRGHFTTADVPRILASGDRRQAGPTAPARGLFLIQVEY